MIVASSKQFQEIKQMLPGFRKFCVPGCGSCVTICHTGGEKQVTALAAQLRLAPTDWSTGMENHPRKMVVEHFVMKKQ